jgi:cytochrome c oxidase subunit IV
VADHAAKQYDAAPHKEHHGPTVRGYLTIGAILFVITVVEILASFLTGPPIFAPAWVQITTLLAFSVLKGALVVMFFMHLRFDSRWFSFFFTSGMILAVFMVIAFIALFAYKAALIPVA